MIEPCICQYSCCPPHGPACMHNQAQALLSRVQGVGFRVADHVRSISTLVCQPSCCSRPGPGSNPAAACCHEPCDDTQGSRQEWELQRHCLLAVAKHCLWTSPQEAAIHLYNAELLKRNTILFKLVSCLDARGCQLAKAGCMAALRCGSTSPEQAHCPSHARRSPCTLRGTSWPVPYHHC